MSTTQTLFNKFHDAIKLDNPSGNEKLREKRDLLLEDIRTALKNRFKDSGKPAPTFDWFNQGSYDMGTGILPLDGDFDIDIGLAFHINKEDHDPVTVKKWIFEALDKVANRTVTWKRPCITVQYHKDGEEHFHVDIASFSHKDSNPDKKYYLAKGYAGSTGDNKWWEESDPMKLKEVIGNKFDDKEESAQFRRVIRYLKRWKDHQFSSDGNAAPTGISLTGLALERFKPITKDYFSQKAKVDDLGALKDWVDAIIGKFTLQFDPEGNEWHQKISCKLPVLPGNDLFEQMSLKQQTDLKAKLEKLRDALIKAIGTKTTRGVSDALRPMFGDDFPEGNDKPLNGSAVAGSSYGG